MTIWLPLPPKGCSINSHTHWRSKAKATKAYREQAKLAAMASGAGLLPTPCTMHITFYNGGRGMDKCYRPRDSDNAIAAMKSAKDGFTDAGIWPSDTARHVRIGDVTLLQTVKEHGNRAGVEVRIEVMTEERR